MGRRTTIVFAVAAIVFGGVLFAHHQRAVRWEAVDVAAAREQAASTACMELALGGCEAAVPCIAEVEAHRPFTSGELWRSDDYLSGRAVNRRGVGVVHVAFCVERADPPCPSAGVRDCGTMVSRYDLDAAVTTARAPGVLEKILAPFVYFAAFIVFIVVVIFGNHQGY